VLRRIFGPNRNEGTGGWRKLHSEELHNLYFSPNINGMIKSEMITGVGMEEMKNAFKDIIRKLKGRRQLERSRRRWEDNFQMDLEETGWEGPD
jgi:hypothetical protein